MFRELIKLIDSYVRLNIADADIYDAKYSACRLGLVFGLTDVIESMDHKVEFEYQYDDNNDCYQIRYVEIDGIAIVRENEIDYDGYNELLEK